MCVCVCVCVVGVGVWLCVCIFKYSLHFFLSINGLSILQPYSSIIINLEANIG